MGERGHWIAATIDRIRYQWPRTMLPKGATMVMRDEGGLSIDGRRSRKVAAGITIKAKGRTGAAVRFRLQRAVGDGR